MQLFSKKGTVIQLLAHSVRNFSKSWGKLSNVLQAPRGDLFSGLVKSYPAVQWQPVSSVSGQAHGNVPYELTCLLVSGSGRHVEHSAVVLPVRSYQ